MTASAGNCGLVPAGADRLGDCCPNAAATHNRHKVHTGTVRFMRHLADMYARRAAGISFHVVLRNLPPPSLTSLVKPLAFKFLSLSMDLARLGRRDGAQGDEPLDRRAALRAGGQGRLGHRLVHLEPLAAVGTRLLAGGLVFISRHGAPPETRRLALPEGSLYKGYWRREICSGRPLAMAGSSRLLIRRMGRHDPFVPFSIVAGCTLSLVAGCFQPDSGALVVRDEQQLSRGYVMMIPGVESYSWMFKPALKGLQEAGVRADVELRQWGVSPLGTFLNLTRLKVNRQRAKEIAVALVEFHRSHPDVPVTIIAYSGGSAIALFAAEALPPDIQLEKIVIIGPAVSPYYDLGPALARTRRGITTFYSARDTFMLGWGTRTFGTMDRVHTNAAGLVGFLDKDAKLRQTPGLKQIPWREEWRCLGHDGKHPGWLAGEWTREVLAREVISTE